MEPILLSTPASDLWQVISENPDDEEVEELLDEMIGQTETRKNEVDIVSYIYEIC